MMESVAARKFLAIPELMERIFTFLDLKSTLSLARVLNKEILKSSMTSKMWTKLIRVNCPDVRILGLLGDAKRNALFAMKNLAALLKLIDGRGQPLLDMLLALISERFPAGPGQGQIELVSEHRGATFKILPAAGFDLLREVECVLGTTEHRINSIKDGFWRESDLLYVGSRISLQQEAVASIRIEEIQIETGAGAVALHNLLLLCQDTRFRELRVVGTIGEGGWKALAEAAERKPNLVRKVLIAKPELAEGRREHIKTLWEALGPGGFFIFKSVADVKAADDDNSWFEIFDWAKLEKILEMSTTDFAAEIITITINDSESESE